MATNDAAPAPRIDDEAGTAPDTEVVFQLVPLYDDKESELEGAIPWVIESASQEDADKVLADIERQLKQATSSTHVGWVTVPRGLSEFSSRVLWPSRYADHWNQCPELLAVVELDSISCEVEESRSKSSAARTPIVRLDFLVSASDHLTLTVFVELTLTGTPDAIEAAHQHILQLAAPRPPRQQYNREPREDY